MCLLSSREEHSLADTLACRYCDRKFKNSKFLQNHEARHESGDLDERAFECTYECKPGEPCGKIFTNRHNLERHLKAHNNTNREHVCVDCGKTFVDSTRLKHHRWIHTGHVPFACEVCGQGFRHKSHLKNHMAKAHGEEKGFACDKCERRFLYAYQLRNHSETHKVEVAQAEVKDSPEVGVPIMQTVYQCSLCQKLFEDYGTLQAHCLTHQAPNGEVTYVTNEPLGANASDQIVFEVTDNGGGSIILNQELPELSQLVAGNGQKDEHFVIVYEKPGEGN